MTKIELTQINATLAADNAALRARVSQLEADLLRVTEVASTLNAPRVHRFDTPQWQKDRAEAMALAKQIAVRSGAMVKV